MRGLGRFCTRRPGWVVTGWLLAAVAVAALVGAFGRPVAEDITLPGSDGQVGRELMERAFAGSGNGTGQLILRVRDGSLADPGRAEAIAVALAEVRAHPHVANVRPPDAAQGTLGADGRIGYATVEFDVISREVDRALAEGVLDAAAPARAAGVETVGAGALARPESGTRTGELLGLAVAALVMVVAFGGLVAAGLPLVTALVTLLCGLGLIGLAGHLTDVPSVATTLATMIGLGVGVDYALFLLTRYRALGRDRAAVVATVASAGTAVVFAGGSVVVAFGGLGLAGVPILTTLAWTAGLVVLLAVGAATTLLPAVLTLLGPRVDALRVFRRPAGSGRSRWGRLAERITRKPGRYALLTTALLVLVTAPVADLETGQLDFGNNPPGTATRTGYDLLAEGFGPGINGPLTVVAALDPPAGDGDGRIAALRDAVARTPGVARTRPAAVSADGRVAAVRAEADSAANDPRTADTIRALRRVTVAGADVHVTGAVAIRGDVGERVARRMPWVIAAVVLLSAVLLLLAFRAPVLALKAAVMNLLSVGTAYGVLTAVFQWGWGVRAIGLDGPVPVEAYVPMMLFALLFGLSMDYEVFLLSAVRDAWRASGDNRAAVRDGLAGTGRVITSAALIMVCVFASFILSPNPIIKMFGLGLAVAIAVDATIIRGLLVPATMALLGDLNWWTPFHKAGRGGSIPASRIR
ncbi:membrane protein [Virgisporangium aliadipatigenens]|uniref:Membrane protein n=2 Tax=Virgisporangium aliadipatigenens TaxID=741659 RepID=A0A8J4DNQ8_9ACTN|nr:membrane protein [Virgisporangium aliadipatigenens]